MKLSKLFRRRRPEVRESYTDQVVARLIASATGASDGSLLAVVETAARLWSAGWPQQVPLSPVNRRSLLCLLPSSPTSVEACAAGVNLAI